MRNIFTIVLVSLPFLSQVLALDYCDPYIIQMIKNSNLKALPAPKTHYFEGQQFKYHYCSVTDKDGINAAKIVFGRSDDNKTMSADYVRYLGDKNVRHTVPMLFTDHGDAYGSDVKGYIDSPTSKNQVYFWNIKGVTVCYFCSLDSTVTGEPLFLLQTLSTECNISYDQLVACQNSINKVNNNVIILLAELGDPPHSYCYNSSLQ